MSQVAGVKLLTLESICWLTTRLQPFRQIKREVLIENAAVVPIFFSANQLTLKPSDRPISQSENLIKIFFSSINGLNLIFFRSVLFTERKHTKKKRKRIRTMPGDCLAIHKSKARRPDPFEKQ